MTTLETRTMLHAALHDRYQIARTLGETDATTVFHARDVRDDRDVVIKVLKLDVAVAVGAELFLREMRRAAALDHPRIVPVRCWWESRRSPAPGCRS